VAKAGAGVYAGFTNQPTNQPTNQANETRLSDCWPDRQRHLTQSRWVSFAVETKIVCQSRLWCREGTVIAGTGGQLEGKQLYLHFFNAIKIVFFFSTLFFFAIFVGVYFERIVIVI